MGLYPRGIVAGGLEMGQPAASGRRTDGRECKGLARDKGCSVPFCRRSSSIDRAHEKRGKKSGVCSRRKTFLSVLTLLSFFFCFLLVGWQVRSGLEWQTGGAAQVRGQIAFLSSLSFLCYR